MRVLVWSSAFWPHLGGLEVLSAELLRAASRRGVEFCVVTTSQGPSLWEGIPVHRFSVAQLALNGDLDEVARTRAQVRRIVREFRPDLVHVNGIGATIPMHILCSTPALPYIVTLHGSWENWRPPLMAQLFANAEWIAACSRDTLGLVRDFDPGLMAFAGVIRNALPEVVSELGGPGPPEFAGYPFGTGRVACAASSGEGDVRWGEVSSEEGFHEWARGDHLLCAGRVASEDRRAHV